MKISFILEMISMEWLQIVCLAYKFPQNSMDFDLLDFKML